MMHKQHGDGEDMTKCGHMKNVGTGRWMRNEIMNGISDRKPERPSHPTGR